MSKGLSMREFARREGVSEMLVRRRVKSGHLAVEPDGTVDARWIGTDWRLSARARATVGGQKPPNARPNRRSATHRELPTVAPDEEVDSLGAPDEDLPKEVGRLLDHDGTPMLTKAEAETKKENYLALLRELQYDREVGRVVEVDDVVSALAAELNLVRSGLRNIGSRVAPRVAVMRDAAQVKALIDLEVDLVLNQVRLERIFPLAAGADAIDESSDD